MYQNYQKEEVTMEKPAELIKDQEGKPSEQDDKSWQELEEALTKYDYPNYIMESY